MAQYNLVTPLAGMQIALEPCGKFLSDANFAAVRATLGEQDSLGDWERAASGGVPTDANNMAVISDLDGVFFLGDRFELLVDVRGFTPKDVTCTVTESAVEVAGTKTAKLDTPNGGFLEQTQTLQRRYFLPQKINPQTGHCHISSEGILFVYAPWN